MKLLLPSKEFKEYCLYLLEDIGNKRKDGITTDSVADLYFVREFFEGTRDSAMLPLDSLRALDAVLFWVEENAPTMRGEATLVRKQLEQEILEEEHSR